MPNAGDPGDRSEALAELLLAGIAHLRADRADAAVETLRLVAEDREFAEAPELDDVRARTWSLYAQALLAAHRPGEAVRWSEAALRAARKLGDEVGILEIRTLHDRIREAITVAAKEKAAREQSARLAALTVDQVLAGLKDPIEQADALVKKAGAELDAGRPAVADDAASRALALAQLAGAVREEVFARIALSRARPQEAAVQLTAAWRRAERADEFNLVGTVARAAELASVRLPMLLGPSGEMDA